MYFSKKRIKALSEIIQNSGTVPIKITFDIGWCDVLELKDTVNILFHAWSIFWKKQYYSRHFAFSGILRKLFIAYDAKSERLKPYFSLLVLSRTPDTDIQNIEHRLYVAWVNALKQHADVAVTVVIPEQETIEETVRVFCTADAIEYAGRDDEPTRVGRTVEETIKTVKERHRFFASSGLFKNVRCF